MNRPTPRQLCTYLDMAAGQEESPFSTTNETGRIIPMPQEESFNVVMSYMENMRVYEKIAYLTEFFDHLNRESPGRVAFSRMITDLEHYHFINTRDLLITVVMQDPKKWWKTLIYEVGTKELKDVIMITVYEDEE